MSQENPTGEEHRAQEPLSPTHSTGTWRTCCLAPTIALALVLLIVIGASLNSRGVFNRQNAEDVSQSRKEAFITFANDYFTIARNADISSKEAFSKLRAMSSDKKSIRAMQTAFHAAAQDNRKAAADFKNLAVPRTLASREKLMRSLETMSKAYAARTSSCEILAAWNGDEQDQDTKARYIAYAEEVKALTESALRDFIEAADENGLTQDDLRRLVTSGAFRTI